MRQSGNESHTTIFSGPHRTILLPPSSPFPVTRMAKTAVEFCVISARGLGRRSSLLKPQWFSVAWVDPNSKYCTKVDASGSSDPSWGMKFSVSIDQHDLSSLQLMALTVEVYRREPIFLREHLQGVAVVQMKEYFDRFAHDEHPGLIEETASFQLRRKRSDKVHGFVDISIRICNEEDVHARFSGSHDGPKYPNQVGITLAIEDGPVYNYPPLPSSHYRDHSERSNFYGNTTPTTPTTQPDQSPSGSNNYSNQPPLIPETLPPPTSNPSYFSPPYPAARGQVPQNYINMPPRRFAGQNGPPNLGMGLGAGALAAGTLIFGENLLPGPSFGAGFDGASLTSSSNAPF